MNEEQRNNEHDDIQHETTEEQELFDDETEQNSWTPTGPMSDLPCDIFKKQLLSSSDRRSILQNEPRNRNISFSPPDMDKRMWTQMSKNYREQDRQFRKLLYRVSAVLRPIDNTLRHIYVSKPDDQADDNAKQAWSQVERTVLNSRTLLLDSLSFGNDIRREQALKSISPSFKRPSDRVEVFGDELSELINRENETNKLFNDAAWQKRRSSQSKFNPRAPTYTPVNFRPPQSYNNNRGRGRGYNFKKNTQHPPENNSNGGQQNHQSTF